MSGAATPPWNASATLVWGPPGDTPEIATLTMAFAQTPPFPNPVPFWRFRDAVEHASETLMNARHAGKAPWIKVGETLFSPMEIEAFYRLLRAGGVESEPA